MAFECSMCSKKFKNINNYNEHQRLHKHMHNPIFKCHYRKCFRTFKKYNSFYMHVYRNHKQINNNKNFECGEANCSYKIASKADLSCHYALHIKTGATVKCPLCKTEKLFKNLSTWRSHICRSHYNFDKEFSTLGNVQKLPCGVYNNYDTNEYNNDNRNDDVVEHNDTTMDLFDDNETLKIEYLKALALLYLTLESKYFLTQNALNIIIDGIQNINDISNRKLIRFMKEQYQIKISNELLNELNYFSSSHDKSTGILRSTFLRKKYYKKEFDFVTPVSIHLGTSNNKSSDFYYVPVLKTLKVLLKNNNIRQQVLSKNSNNNRTDIFSDITDGSVYKNNSFFSENPNALRLLLFQDAFEVCNVLGSARKRHKIVGIYMILGNLETFHWSKVDNICLVALVLNRDLEKFGPTKIFDVIVKDIQILESEGIDIGNKQIKGSLLAVLGDNLGSHQIGGFSENFSSCSYVCRYCYIKTENINTQFSGFQNRTKETYETDVQIHLMANESHHRGVKSNSILNNLNFFHVCNPGLPPCVAHDLFEGVVQYDLALAINYFIKKRIFTIDILNERLRQLKLDDGERIPKFIFKKNMEKLPGSAHENIIFIMLLPFTLYDLFVDCCDEVWIMILKLREICNIVLSFKLHISQIAYLQTLITEYLEKRTFLFPEVKLRPKHHYLLHYPKLMTQFGPLRLLWTMRFESKHKYFKNIIKHSPNFKNVLFSLSEKHQFLEALHLYQSSSFSDQVIADNVSPFAVKDYPASVAKLFATFQNLQFVCTYATFRGTIYKENMHICCGRSEGGGYIVLKIVYILINNNYSELSFIGNSLEIYYDESSGLYLSPSVNYSKLVYAHYKDLLSHESLYCLKTGDQWYFYFKSSPYTADKQLLLE